MRRELLCSVGAVVALAAMLGSAAAEPCLRGFNLAGGEFGKLPGVLWKDYTYPAPATIDTFVATGASVIRLPVRWERLQPVLGEQLSETELAALDAAVDGVTAAGLTVVIDVHNYGYYAEKQIGSADVPTDAFAQFWARLASHYAGREGVVFSLMNEPYDIAASDWLKITNAAIAAIRVIGADNLILVSGTAYAGAHSWSKTLATGNNADVMAGVADPANRYAYDFHQYLDADFSGRNAECSGAATAIEGVRSVTAWLKKNGKHGFLGEFAASKDPACIAAMKDLVGVIDHAPEQWIGWTYWAGGAWWPTDYIFTAQPDGNGDRPQVAALKPVLGPGNASACTIPAKGPKP